MNWNTAFKNKMRNLFGMKLYLGRSLTTVPQNALVLFPCRQATLHCGLAGVVALKAAIRKQTDVDLDDLEMQFKAIAERTCSLCSKQDLPMESHHLNGRAALDDFFNHVKSLKHSQAFIDLFLRPFR